VFILITILLISSKFTEYEQKEEDLAQYEEEEALAIQRRLLESMTESDIGIELLIGEYEPKTVSQNQSINEDKEEDEEKLETNLSTLTKRQKIEILKKESPELEALINDFRTYMNEIRDRLHPIMLLIRDGKVRDSMGFKYIETKYQIIINYCVNICFYLVLKSKRIPVKDHPIIKQLLSYKKLLLELNSITSNNSSINEDIDLVLEKLSKGEDIKFFRKRFNQNKRKSEETKDRLKKVKFADNLEMNETLAEDEELDSESNAQLSKRGITYEIAKNKGLTPKRKKELKNPRVKHRMKYRKAKIRRKGQVREPRKELQRYGGEISGIKSGVVKSIKFK
jgi:U3 small nucleolar RNA-associated protein 3